MAIYKLVAIVAHTTTCHMCSAPTLEVAIRLRNQRWKRAHWYCVPCYDTLARRGHVRVYRPPFTCKQP